MRHPAARHKWPRPGPCSLRGVQLRNCTKRGSKGNCATALPVPRANTTRGPLFSAIDPMCGPRGGLASLRHSTGVFWAGCGVVAGCGGAGCATGGLRSGAPNCATARAVEAHTRAQLERSAGN